MTDYEYLFATTVHQKLKDKVKSRVFVTVTKKDELYVKIYRDDEEHIFETTLSDFTNRLVNGLSSDYAVYEVVNRYKKFIFKCMEEEYFYLN